MSQAAEQIIAQVDSRLRERVLEEYRSAAGRAPLSPGPRVVLVGHRGAGKTTLLPRVAAWLGRAAVDLDAEVERALGRPLREVFQQDERRFRAAERERYAQVPPGTVVAAGGGFLALHADLLGDDTAVLVPVSFQTYRERLLQDATRPRLRPELSAEDELRAVYEEREAIHRARVQEGRVVGLGELLARVGAS
ncbi:MAG TPA: shikimate kinase [Myxococcales bacterium]|nr:shikimate kinase [Myxococcales bacterium]